MGKESAYENIDEWLSGARAKTTSNQVKIQLSWQMGKDG